MGFYNSFRNVGIVNLVLFMTKSQCGELTSFNNLPSQFAIDFDVLDICIAIINVALVFSSLII